MLDVVILAAGKGTRMQSDLPKVLHKLAGKAFLDHVLTAVDAIDVDKTHVVIGHGAELLEQHLENKNINIVLQAEQLGTGHAVDQALPMIDEDKTVLILYGDVPLIKPQTLNDLVKKVDINSLALLTVTLKNPAGYGRIVRDDEDQIQGIVEQKDANKEQLRIDEVNTGVMAIKASHLKRWLPSLENNNSQGEYYLTDIVALAAREKITIASAEPSSEEEVQGINDRIQQAQLERYYQRAYAEKIMIAGAAIADPNRFDCRGNLSVGRDVTIDINCVFEGEVTLGDGVVIGPNCVIKNATIGSGTVVDANSIIEDAVVESQCTIGPYARLRPGTHLADKAKVGNFVETKKAVIGKGSKVNHLSYIGDAEVGTETNIGAGTITCNYDGVNKHKTIIGNDTFIGSNTSLVAPVEIGDKATVAAGSTVTTKVDSGQLAVARGKQRNIDGWKPPKKK